MAPAGRVIHELYIISTVVRSLVLADCQGGFISLGCEGLKSIQGAASQKHYVVKKEYYSVYNPA